MTRMPSVSRQAHSAACARAVPYNYTELPGRSKMGTSFNGKSRLHHSNRRVTASTHTFDRAPPEAVRAKQTIYLQLQSSGSKTEEQDTKAHLRIEPAAARAEYGSKLCSRLPALGSGVALRLERRTSFLVRIVYLGGQMKGNAGLHVPVTTGPRPSPVVLRVRWILRDASLRGLDYTNPIHSLPLRLVPDRLAGDRASTRGSTAAPTTSSNADVPTCPVHQTGREHA